MAKQGTLCPLLQKACVEHKCAWYTQLRGTNPNTGNPVDEWGCAMAWLPILLVENTGQQRQTGAAIESLRNENIKGIDATRAVLMRGFGGDPRLEGS